MGGKDKILKARSFMNPRKLKPKPAVEKSINPLADPQKSQEFGNTGYL